MKSRTEVLTVFRVHYQDGHQKIEATSPDEARKLFTKRHPGTRIEKVKRVKGGES